MKKYILFCLSCILFTSLKATHNRAGEILYIRITPFVQGGVPVYTYSITVIKYMDSGQGIGDRCVDTVYFGDGQKAVAPRNNGLSAPCMCGSINGNAVGCGSLIINSLGYVVNLSTYAVVHTFAGPGIYLIRSMDFTRNQDIRNIPNSVNQPLYLEASLIIKAGTDPNTSPVLMSLGVAQASVGVCFNYSLNAVDADGDSLSYQLTTCRDQNGQPAPGYFLPETSSSFSLDPVSGVLTWCTPQWLSMYNIALFVYEWRKNASNKYELIGIAFRDMQILVRFGVVGIGENKFSGNVKIHPNPFREILAIDLGTDRNGSNGKVEMALFSNDGKEVCNKSQEDVNGKLAFPLEGLASGIYLLRLKTEQGLDYKKVVRE